MNLHPRKYLPDLPLLESWDILKNCLNELENWKFNSVADLLHWLSYRSELEAYLEEDFAWRYIHTNQDTRNEEYLRNFKNFVDTIEPELNHYLNQLDQILLDCPFLNQITSPEFSVFIRRVKTRVRIFQKNNITIIRDLQMHEQAYNRIASNMTVYIKNKEFTLKQAADFLKNPDRELRKQVFEKIKNRRLQDAVELNHLFSFLVKNRNQLGVNSGFANYIQYRFADLGRFDYSINDCKDFHQSVFEHVRPILLHLRNQKKNKPGFSSLRPFDLEFDFSGQTPLNPFTDSADLLSRTIQCFTAIHADFGTILKSMAKNHCFDLETRFDKAPGAFNYPLFESKLSFVFMSATGGMHDLETMVHECGHALHSILSSHFNWAYFKDIPAEIAELASMSVELIVAEHYHHFFTDENEITRAKLHILEQIVENLCWVAIIDKFQHWVYTNPHHEERERMQVFKNIYTEFHGDSVDWSGYEEYLECLWQTQLHLFEAPFYYIEYGFAQLGALGIWMKYRENPASTLDNFIAALKLGYSKTIPQVYDTAGVKFNFSPAHVENSMIFLHQEIETLQKQVFK